MYIVLAVILLGIMMVGVFFLGGMYTRHIILDSLDEARRQRVAEDYYRLAGCRKYGDPAPYVPPTPTPKTPGARMIPHMGALERRLHEGRRGTIMVRAGDRRRNAM